jgi:transposase
MSTQLQPQAQGNETPRRIIGIDLGVTARHRAAILNPATNQFVVRTLRFRPVAKELDALLRKARAQGSGRENASRVQLTATLEATHMSWYLVSHYLQQQGVTVYRVNGRMTKQLRRVATPHAQSDAIDAQVLARLPGACPEQLYPLTVPMVDSLALKRYVLEYARWRTAATAIKNRLTAYDHAFWPGMAGAVPAKARDWVRENWFDPWEVLAVGEDALQEAWREAAPRESGDWIHDWYRFTAELSRLYVAPLTGMHHLQSLIRYQLRQLAYALEQQNVLMQEYILPLYRELSPNSLLTTIYGIAEPSAAIYHAYIQDISRFPTPAAFRQWCGIVPRSHQSGQHNAKGGHITQAGPNLVKATLYMNALVARQYDIGLARVYYTQMVTHGKHHNQAAVACASHLASRIYAILSKQTPYEVRDLEGNPISVEAAQAYIRAHFTVPEEVRLRSNTQRRSPSPLDGQETDEQNGETSGYTTGDTSLSYPEEFGDN